jgi:hypothetical protein
MRLLHIEDDGSLSLGEFIEYAIPEYAIPEYAIPKYAIPKYAILSHTWGKDSEEVNYQDLVNKTGKHKRGQQKLQFCADKAQKDGLRYFWVDTCCR